MVERFELDEVTFLSAFAMGVPGKRTFFLIIGQKGEWVRAWLEKEQLEALGLAIDQLLLALTQQEHLHFPREVVGTPLSDEVPPELPSVELDIDQIALGYHQERVALDFLAHVLGKQMEDQAELYCRVTLAQLKKLGNQAKNICAAGRPRCVLCGSPIDPTTGHICPMSN